MNIGEAISTFLDRQDGASDCRRGLDPRCGMSQAYYAGYAMEYADQEAKTAMSEERYESQRVH